MLLQARYAQQLWRAEATKLMYGFLKRAREHTTSLNYRPSDTDALRNIVSERLEHEGNTQPALNIFLLIRNTAAHVCAKFILPRELTINLTCTTVQSEL